MRLSWSAATRAGALAASLTFAGVAAGLTAGPAAASPGTSCQLGPHGQVKHVIILQFDNVHLRRDNANVPSDIQQIPALYNFLKGQGTLLSNDHTVLISHTADGITSTETGLFPGNEGLGVANTFPYLDSQQHGTSGTKVPGVNTGSAFTYWTDPVSSDDPLYEMISSGATTANPNGVNTPAPWVPFTQSGCDFAGIGSANMEFENDTSDIKNVYGPTSTQYQFGNWSYNTAYGQHFTAGSNLGTTDFEGLAVHCSAADSEPGGRCSSTNGGGPDVLPSDPSYSGYNALFGAVNVNPLLTGKSDQPLPSGYTPSGDTAPPSGNWQAPPVYDVFAPNANNSGSGSAPVHNVGANTTPPPSTYSPGTTPTTQVLDQTANAGFPGFNGMEANNALGYTAAAQEAGIPVTYTYLSDVHDDQYDQNHNNAFGPGEAGYEAQLHQYNAAFAAFFHRLASHGITTDNSVFLVTVDEGDHYAGGGPLNSNCDGATVPCQYDTAEAGGAAYGTSGYQRNVGEIDVNLPKLLQSEGDSTTFGFDADDAPAIIVPNQSSPSGAAPSQTSNTVRDLERTIGTTQEYDPINGQTIPITSRLADQTEESILHMVNADPARTPTFTLFGNPDFYFQGSCSYVGSAQGQTPGPVTTHGAGCPAQGNGYAWNHGDIQQEIGTTWQGWAGVGIKNLGETGQYWTDHTDARPTLLTLLGLHDSYSDDGAALAPMLTGDALPASIRTDHKPYDELFSAYEQLNAPFGQFSMDSLTADSNAVQSGSDGSDSNYGQMDSQLQQCATDRSSLAAEIQSDLQNAETGGSSISAGEASTLSAKAEELIADAETLASSSTAPSTNVCS